MTVVTGQSGSGKTTILKSLGYASVYFADEFVKNVLYKKGHPVYNKIVEMFTSLKQEEYIDTKELGPILFGDKDKLEQINKLIFEYVSKWLKSLPGGAIVEMAAYMHLEEMYKPFFGKVVLVERDNKDTSKFDHIEKQFQPIENKKIKYDILIKNNGHIADATIELKGKLFENKSFMNTY